MVISNRYFQDNEIFRFKRETFLRFVILRSPVYGKKKNIWRLRQMLTMMVRMIKVIIALFSFFDHFRDY